MAEKNTTFGDKTNSSLLGINQVIGDNLQNLEEFKKQIFFDLRCCCPAIIKSINYEEMTVSVQPVIKEKIKFGTQEIKEFQLPEIFDVPLIFLSSNQGINISFPVKEEDECLLFFADTCIDTWWQSGGIQSQFEERRHDMSDCFCLPCQMSQKNKINDITESLKLKYKNSEFEIKEDGIYINGFNINNHRHQVQIGDQVYTTSAWIQSKGELNEV